MKAHLARIACLHRLFGRWEALLCGTSQIVACPFNLVYKADLYQASQSMHGLRHIK